MSDNQVSDILAQAFAAEGVDTLFTLMGDANMYWSAAMADHQRARLIHARHEHCAVAMADAYARASGKVGVASVTCGPGYTQIMTALTMAARGNAPVVVFAGDAPIDSPWYLQQIDQAPLALATGAAFIPVRTIGRALDCVREAFYVARLERRPVVLSVPLDLQKEPFPSRPDYTPSTDLMPRAQIIPPDPAAADEVASMIASAEHPVVIGGRGAIWSGARQALEALAEESGALLATTLLAKGLFDGNPFAFDIAGGFSTDLGREFFAESDLVIGFGAGLGHYTTDGGHLYPKAKVVQVDINPRGLWQGLRTADLHIRADARATAEAVTRRLRERGIRRSGWRSNLVAARIAADLPDAKEFAVTPGTLDPRPVLREIDDTVPKDWDVVVAGGHCFSFAMTHLKGRPGGNYHIPIDFGAIGSGLSAAIGVAVAGGNDKVMLIDGDGSLYQHIQELETVRRHGLKLLICILNDGGYGAETHKFRSTGGDPNHATHGRGDIAAIARGFGLDAARVTEMGQFEHLFRDYQQSSGSMLWDVHIDDLIPSRHFRRVHYGEA
ncbi:MAG: thiamine pyrophosphate-binding protein [Alphaproteobacteria bacterium]|nr:thiamine pyrophosphate-binding protein [Alphaproteobacteria bacterium]MBV9964193.1 thiamine pyrophosphate-binding protein [Alphaproteobacteria bacterium]